MEIQFLNHASVKIKTEDAVILTDPWLKGSSFNDGWDLLVQTTSIETAIKEVTHIWISHEHPDHFSIPFFSSLSQGVKKRIEVLFQKTKDNRVCAFLQKKGFHVRELGHYEPHRIGTTELCIGKTGFYDSHLYLRDGTASLLNINDCAVEDAADLNKMRNRFGSPTVLLGQFSYAAWLGGRKIKSFRRQLAHKKLTTLKTQACCLGAEYVIPFASFIYFSNEENFYMNDSINTIDSVFLSWNGLNSQLIALKPEQCWTVGGDHDNMKPRLFWRKKFSEIASMPRRKPGDSVDAPTLQEAFEHYRARVFAKNSPTLIRLAKWLPGLGAFKPFNIKLYDLNGGGGGGGGGHLSV